MTTESSFINLLRGFAVGAIEQGLYSGKTFFTVQYLLCRDLHYDWARRVLANRDQFVAVKT